MSRAQGHLSKALVLAIVFVSTVASVAAAQSNSVQNSAPAQKTSPPAKKFAPAQRSSAAHSPYKPSRFPKRAEMYYTEIWGLDSLEVKSVESGEMIRFSYRILDPDKAKTLNDKKYNPSLIDEKAHVKLVVPQMEKVGQLRQTAEPETGREYWMLFSNKGRLVKRGDRVDVVIGQFRAQGLVVD